MGLKWFLVISAIRGAAFAVKEQQPIAAGADSRIFLGGGAPLRNGVTDR